MNKIIKSGKVNNKILLLTVNPEKVYRVFYNGQELMNDLDFDEAEFIFDLAMYGYDVQIILEDDND